MSYKSESNLYIEAVSARELLAAKKKIPSELKLLKIGDKFPISVLEYKFNIRGEQGLMEILEEYSTWEPVKGSPETFELIDTKPKIVVTIESPSEQNPKQGEKFQWDKKIGRKIRKENWYEAPGSYPNLNIYESSLLNYLVKTFGKAEFGVLMVDFQLKKSRGSRNRLEHLDYLARQGYLEQPVFKGRDFYFKVK